LTTATANLPSAFIADGVTAVPASELLGALNHPIRRNILRFLLASAPASSTEIRRSLSGPVGNNINFHFDILVAAGAVERGHKQVGYRENFYSPTDATSAAWFRTVLQLTEAED